MIVLVVPGKRKSYRQFCGMARALDRVGERWTLTIVRNLLLGPRRYSDLLQELPGITTNLLAKRLREMTAAGLIEKTQTAAPLRVPVYALTSTGAALEPVIMELGRWGARFLGDPAGTDTVNIAWGLLSLKRRYRGGLRGTLEFRVGDRSFELSMEPSYLGVLERQSTNADLSIQGSLESFQKWLFRGASAEELRQAGSFSVRGDEARFQELTSALDPPQTS
jgi:DNA-binding HxlR family transcriptional regulator